MSTSVTFNNSTYTVPSTGEEDWGGATEVDGLLVALAGNALSKYGGTFALSTEVDFGGTAGIKALTYKSRGTNVSGVGILRLANAESIGFRNAGNTANHTFTLNSSDELEWLLTSTTLLRLTSTGSLVLGSAAVATSATNGFLYVTGCAGLPTGVPTTNTGRVAIVIDTTNDTPYYYNSSWKAFGQKQTVIGTAQTSTSASNANTSYTAFSTNNPTASITPARTGKFRVFSAPVLLGSAVATQVSCQLANTVGSATVDFSQTSFFDTDSANFARQCYVYQMVTLTSGTLYTWVLQGKVDGAAGNSCRLENAQLTNGLSIVIEEI